MPPVAQIWPLAQIWPVAQIWPGEAPRSGLGGGAAALRCACVSPLTPARAARQFFIGTYERVARGRTSDAVGS